MPTILNESSSLRDVLKHADSKDLSILVDVITDKGEGRVSLASDVCKKLFDAKNQAPKTLSMMYDVMATEIELFGGNSIANLFRGGKGVDYREILIDVAKHIKINFSEAAPSADIEIQILLKILEKSMDQMTAQERENLISELSGGSIVGGGVAAMAGLQAAIRAGGFASYRVSLIVANTIARQFTGKGLQLAANAGIARGIGAFAGPVGWAITAIWTAYDLAAPAYRVTVPSVVLVAYMRQKALSESVPTCPKCKTPIPGNPKFCAECGTPLGAK